ncbi:MAG TPA: chitobiase/beta-hexosaminidase C-terminal domain-containing protein [Gaiellaceae bacterium]|jgi:peptidoglycan/xylan/chitin deacetylase (PgdA/CDA1 family)/archaellum component FlaF (FlaF/FlaG flagellin family)|nr:chitobiase/beta-hexosaminidase C-terminal domain-containing protein [Gaiellaceae bacterium]
MLLLGKSDSRNAAAAASPTIVSITFDDGWADQMLGLPILKGKHMVATYFLNSPRIGGDSAYMTWANIASLSQAGNEIGGHTAYHPDLTAIDPTEAQRQICYDRVNLINHGYNVTDFAYPFGANNTTVQGYVQACGYDFARTVAQTVASPVPPTNPYAVPIGDAASNVPALEAAVTAAENAGGGWVPLVFHHICNSCDPDYITQGDFQTFINWLAGQVQTNNVVVNTVHDVLGGTFQPAVSGPPLPPPVGGASTLKNASFELDLDNDQQPDCWNFDDFGNNTYQWTRTSDAHTGSWAEKVVVTNYHDGDNKLDGQVDLGFCTPTVTPGHQYKISEWYKSDAPVFFTTFTRDSNYTSSFWQSSPNFPASSTWAQATWVTPAIPSGINGLTFGLTLGSNGTLTVDDASVTDNAVTGADTTPPTASMTSPSAGVVSGKVAISANASDNVAIDHLDFLVDGNVVGSTMTPPYSFGWNSKAVANGTHTISVRAVDTSGNRTTTSTVSVTVLNQNTNLLQNPGLESGSGNTPTCWQLAGYGTNTPTWTWTNDSHNGAAAENLTITAYTNGDRKMLTAFNSCTPTVAPGHTYTITAWYKSTAKPAIFTFLSSSGANGPYAFFQNSPAQAISAGWTQATWSTPVIPAGGTNLSIGMGLTSGTGSLTMDDFTMSDNAPQPDTTPPVSTLVCNDGGENGPNCQTWYNAPVDVSISATDDLSGVQKIVYTTDGSTPSLTNGTVYAGDFLVGQTATVKYRAFDVAGNAEAVKSQLIQIDTTPPTASIQCNNGSCGVGIYNAAVSVTLAETDSGGSGTGQIYYTTDGTTPAPDNGNFYLGAFSVSQTSTVKFVAYDAVGNVSQVYSQLITVDTTAPVSAITCNSATCQPTYNAPVQVALAATDDPGGSGVAAIYYTTDGTTPTSTNGSTYSSPFTVSATTTVKYRAVDNAANLEPVNTEPITVDTTAPTVSLTAPAANAIITDTTQLTANASDNLMVDHVDFLVDGSVVGTATTSPYVFSWNSASVADGTHTMAARAVDSAGNQTTTQAVTVTVDNTPPSSTISCNSATCSADPYSAPVFVSLQATDDSGSGVFEIVYTTDGSYPTLSNGAVYTAPFTLSSTTTVKYRAFDVAGNAETANSQTIAIPPAETVTLTAPLDGSTVSGTSVTLTATVSNGTPDRVDLLVDGNVVGSANTSPYTLNWDSTTVPDGSHTVSAQAITGTTTVNSNTATVTVSNGTPPPDTTPPTSTIACDGAACQSAAYTNPVSVSLAATDDPGGSGVAAIYYTTDGTTPSQTNGTVYSAPFSVQTTTTVEYRAIDNAGNLESTNSQTVTIDQAAPGIDLTTPSTGDTISGTVPLSATVTGISPDRVDFLVDGSVVGSDTSAPYTVGWDSTTVLNGPHSIMAQAIVGGTSTDSNTADVTVQQAPPPDTTPPTSAINCNDSTCSGFFNAAVSVTLSATDNPGGSGVNEIVYTTDGSTPSLNHGTVYGGGFSVGSATTVKYRAFDNAGNAEAVHSQPVQFDTIAPATTLKCNGTTCAGSWYTTAVSVTLTATDSGGSGVNEIVYTTDGSDPTASNGTTYSGVFTLGTTTNLRYRAIDNAGNLETVKSAQLQIDVAAPATAIQCNTGGCGGFFNVAVSVTLSSADNPGGSGVSQIVYTTDGTTPTQSHGTVYAGTFSITQTMTVKYRAFDVAGNQEAVNSQLIQIDTVAPSSTLKCNGTTCSGSFYSVPVQVTLTATDSGGSGVNRIVYTTDGSNPTATNGTAYSAPFTLTTTTNLRYRAIDNAGNLEPVNSAQLQIDTVAPTTAANCNGSPCTASHPYKPGLSVSLVATDNQGGSGVAQTRYTTDGTVPTKTTGNIYSGNPFTLSSTATVNYRSYDVVGNLEADNSVQISIDGTVPTVTLTAPAANSLATGTITLSANASDNVAVASVDFLVDGNVVGSSSAAPYSFSWNSTSVPDGSHTIAARATDTAGNQATTSTITVTTINTNLLPNPGLEQGSGNTPSCYILAGYGTNTPTWTWTTDAHSGSHAENLTISSWTNGDRKMLQNFTPACATATSAGHQYLVTAWYKSTAPSVIFAFASTTGAYNWWAQSPQLPVASSWTQVSWTTPVVPSGFASISTGMGMQNAGSLTMDDFGLYQIK